MSAPRSHGQPSPTVCTGIVIAMLAMIIIPAAITLHTVQSPVALVPTSQNPTPHGYTWSLLLFIVPGARQLPGRRRYNLAEPARLLPFTVRQKLEFEPTGPVRGISGGEYAGRTFSRAASTHSLPA